MISDYAYTTELDNWLSIACEDLSQPAKDRISLDIKAHYWDSVEALRDEGLSEADAQAKAFVILGDADAAGKSFRRQHLSHSEFEMLKRLLKKPTWLSVLRDIAFTSTMFLVAKFIIAPRDPKFFQCLAEMLVLSLFFIALNTVILASKRKPDAVEVTTYNVLENFGCMMVLMNFFIRSYGSPAVGCFFGLYYHIHRSVRLYFKLRRIGVRDLA